jgi:hypothetical protein
MVNETPAIVPGLPRQAPSRLVEVFFPLFFKFFLRKKIGSVGAGIIFIPLIFGSSFIDS